MSIRRILRQAGPLVMAAVLLSTINSVARIDNAAAMEFSSTLGNRVVPPVDDRVPVSPTTANMISSATVKILATTPNGNLLNCTGFLYSPSTVLTAGHCVYNRDPSDGPNGFMQDFWVAPGLDWLGSTPFPYGLCTWRAANATNGWIVNGAADADMGEITLQGCGGSLPEQPAGFMAGWYGNAAVTFNIDNYGMTLNGYPIDIGSGDTQYSSSGQIKNTTTTLYEYDADMESGQSGSAVRVPACGNLCSVAVNTHNVGVSYNRGTRFTAANFPTIRFWRHISYAVSGASDIPLDLTSAEVRDFYLCNLGPAYTAMLPTVGGGWVKNAWIRSTYPGGTLPSPTPSCVQNGTDENGALIQENRGTQVNKPTEIVPFWVDSWEDQTSGRVPNVRGTTRVGQIDGISPFADATDTPNLTFAVAGVSDLPLDLSLDELRDFYSCSYGPSFKMMLPQAGAVRTKWLAAVYPSGTPSPLPSCVQNGLDENGAPIIENRGTQVGLAELVPYSVFAWEDQTAGRANNYRATTRIGQIDGRNPFAARFTLTL